MDIFNEGIRFALEEVDVVPGERFEDDLVIIHKRLQQHNLLRPPHSVRAFSPSTMEFYMTILSAAEADFESAWEKVKGIFIADVEPVLKTFIKQFDSQFGAQAITAALGAVATLTTGNIAFGEVATGLATTLYADAKADAATDASLDATQVLQTIQSALQVAKAVNGVVTPADQTAAAAIASAAPAAAS
jgi:hypothetical protein